MKDRIIGKIQDAAIIEEPFKHLEIHDLLDEETFQELINSRAIKVPEVKNLGELDSQLRERSFAIIEFPGCFSNISDYKKSRNKDLNIKLPVEGMGLVYRLYKLDGIIKRIMDVFESREFHDALCEKFNVTETELTYDGGVQKYLDGYEISPHPDIRRKALTWMYNMNPINLSEEFDYHTHLCALRKEFSFVSEFWRGNASSERCWLPWDWCETVKETRLNNSLTIFSPNNESLHAVRARYDHLKTQRTQIYGNLWYAEQKLKPTHYTQFESLGQPYVASAFKSKIKKQLKRFGLIQEDKTGQRNV